MKVLIAIDGSAASGEMLADLPYAGLPPEGEALAISVADVWLPSDAEDAEPPGALSAPIRQARKRALSELNVHREIARVGAAKLASTLPGWRVDSFACGDSPAWGIVQKAAEWKADLVVVGTHGRRLLQRVFLGSVGHRVVAEAHCSVRVARFHRPSNPQGIRILFAVDGSRDCMALSELVLRRSWPAGTRFELLTVMDSRLRTAGAWPSAPGFEWEWKHFKDANDWVSQMLEPLSRRFRERGLAVETHVLEGDPKQELVRQAAKLDVDTLLVGARGSHHGHRMFLGSVASAVAARARCSVEVLRPVR